MDIYDLLYLFRENIGTILICAGMSSYIIGLLNLAVLGSPMFNVCSYVGTILSFSGALALFGVLPKTLISKGGLSVTLFFISVLLFTTVAIIPFIDVSLKLQISEARFAANLAKLRNRQSQYGIDPLGGAGNAVLTIQRPHVWLLIPLITIGAILLICAMIIQFYIHTG